MCCIQQLMRTRTAIVLASLYVSMLFTSLTAAESTSPDKAVDVPHLNDPRYTVSLYADAPEIRTPIGAAVDADGRLFVVESHTLTPPPDYDGPKTDRIKVFVDADQDGKPDRTTIFADGLKSAMNLTLTPDGAMYVTCSRRVLRLKDTDGDGRAEQPTTIVQLETVDTFPFGYLSSTVFGPDGWLYISFGEFPFTWKVSGTDGTTIEGWGGGDGVFRCRPDGTQLQRVATGFWAPFAMTLDAEGRLLMLDNDPFSRGPNRLIHIVPAGDYGHRWLYGFSGSHPLNGWSGDLPGTLPPLTAVGESPAGMIACATGRFPPDFATSLLVTTWGGNAIERHELTWRDTSAEAKRVCVGSRWKSVSPDRTCPGQPRCAVHNRLGRERFPQPRSWSHLACFSQERRKARWPKATHADVAVASTEDERGNPRSPAKP